MYLGCEYIETELVQILSAIVVHRSDPYLKSSLVKMEMYRHDSFPDISVWHHKTGVFNGLIQICEPCITK